MQAHHGRMQQDNTDLTRQLEESESQCNQLNKAKQALSKQLEELRAQLEDESRMRAKLQGEARNMQQDNDTLREQMEEEQEGKSDLQRLLTKANAELTDLRRKVESGEVGVRTEEIDAMRKKMQAKLSEAESALDAAHSKISSLEKVKTRLQGEIEDIMIDAERVSSNNRIRPSCLIFCFCHNKFNIIVFINI